MEAGSSTGGCTIVSTYGVSLNMRHMLDRKLTRLEDGDEIDRGSNSCCREMGLESGADIHRLRNVEVWL